MTFKSLFTVWDGAEESRVAFDLAVRLTRESDGHLDILCIASDNAPDAFYGTDMALEVLKDIANEAREEAEQLKASAREMAEREPIAYSLRAMPVRHDDVARIVGREGRFHDLIVLPRPYGRENEAMPEHALDGALFDTLAPVLVCPPKVADVLGQRIMVAWNGDMEALRAIRAALPLLKEAKSVEVVTVDSHRKFDSRADSCLALMTMLTRHGVNAVLSPVPRLSDRISKTLRQKALDCGADMIVMGAYGHSRFRERLLGGATREMLQDSELPILMTH